MFKLSQTLKFKIQRSQTSVRFVYLSPPITKPVHCHQFLPISLLSYTDPCITSTQMTLFSWLVRYFILYFLICYSSILSLSVSTYVNYRSAPESKLPSHLSNVDNRLHRLRNLLITHTASSGGATQWNLTVGRSVSSNVVRPYEESER